MQSHKNKKKIHVLLLITKNNFGGAQKYVFDLAKNLNKNIDFIVNVASGDYEGSNGELDEKLKSIGVKVIKIKTLKNSLNPINLIKQTIELRKIIQNEKPDILHINSSMAGLSGILSTFFIKTKIIFTAHGWPFNEDRNIFIKILLKNLLYIVILFSHKTISVSENLKDEVNTLLHKKINIIYNGIDIDEKKSINDNPKSKSESIILNREEFDKDCIHLLSVGELHPVKGYDLVIDSLYHLKNIKSENKYIYHIFGDGQIKSKLKKSIQKYGLEKQIILYGNIPDARKYINQFDIFIMPSRSEALGYALIEAYHSGIPIIHTLSGGMKEVNKIFTDHNPKNKTRSITTNTNIKSFVEILINKSLINNLLQSKSEKEDIPQLFKTDSMTKETIKVYRSTL